MKERCGFADCQGRPKAMGLCNAHYRKWQRSGYADGWPVRTARRRPAESPEAAFLERTEPLLWSGCLIWTGPLNESGYGVISVGGKKVRAHRYAYEREHGPIPAGALVDHACRNRSCVQVDHLRLATQQENQFNRRGANADNAGTGLLNITYARGSYHVRVTKGGRGYGHSHKTLDSALAERAKLRKELFGEYDGSHGPMGAH